MPPLLRILPYLRIRATNANRSRIYARRSRKAEIANLRFSTDEGWMSEWQRLGRGVTIALMLAAWFSISNHCLIAAAGPEPVVKSEAGCPFHAKHAGPAQPKPARELPCCKVLRAVVAKSVKPSGPRLFALLDISWPANEAAFHLLEPAASVRPPLDTGPPASPSFAELILQRSLLAHAPPRFA